MVDYAKESVPINITKKFLSAERGRGLAYRRHDVAIKTKKSRDHSRDFFLTRFGAQLAGFTPVRTQSTRVWNELTTNGVLKLQ